MITINGVEYDAKCTWCWSANCGEAYVRLGASDDRLLVMVRSGQ